VYFVTRKLVGKMAFSCRFSGIAFAKNEAPPLIHVYVRSPDDGRTTFWFVGKIARNVDTKCCYIHRLPTRNVLSQETESHSGYEAAFTSTKLEQVATLELWLALPRLGNGCCTKQGDSGTSQGSMVDLSDDFSVRRLVQSKEFMWVTGKQGRDCVWNETKRDDPMTAIRSESIGLS
jgi:hypothetical protein